MGTGFVQYFIENNTTVLEREALFAFLQSGIVGAVGSPPTGRSLSRDKVSLGKGVNPTLPPSATRSAGPKA